MRSAIWLLAGVLVTAGLAATAQANFITNGDFSNGLTGWSTWVQRDDYAGVTGQFLIDVPAAQELRLRGYSYNGGVYQVVPVPIGVPLTIDGVWRTVGAVADAQWAELVIYEGNTPPIAGTDTLAGRVIFKNSTFASDTGGRTTGWGVSEAFEPLSSATVVNRPTRAPLGTGSTTGFVTVILKAGSIHAGVNTNKVVRWDNIVLTPEPASLMLLGLGCLAVARRRRHA